MNATVEVVKVDNTAVEVLANDSTSLELTASALTSIVTSISLPGPAGPTGAAGQTGPAGPPGPSEIGGYPFLLDLVAAGDHLQFSGSAWVNVAKETLADGGNF